ncbi:MAG TPA: phosphodiester glycosidase family protein [Myxococcales bacterium]|jgi:hypothetical protein
MRHPTVIPLLALAAAALLLLPAAPARAADTWTTPEPGLRHLHRTASGPVEYDALFVDLCDPSLDLRATKSAERQRTPSAWGTAVGARAAINGDFFNYTDYSTVGLAMGDGAAWPGTSDNATWALFAAGKDGRVEIRLEAESLGATPEAWMREIVGGDPNCLVAGVAKSSADSHYGQLHPRSAVGLSQDRRLLVLLVVDGRSTASVGVTTFQLGQILLSLGAWDGMNFDGGGSSALWLATEGVVNNPSDGSQRVVANHLGVLRRAVPAGEPSRCCSPEAVAGATGFFDDVAGTFWGFEAIEALRAAGVTQGCSASPPYFCPDCRSTRASAVTFLARALGWTCNKPATATFGDVPTTHAQFAEIECALAHGLTQGCGGGNFCPDDPASRATVALFAARAMGLSTTAPATSPFSDVAVTDAAAGAIVSLVDRCIVGGCSPGLFCPDRTATRAELSVITARAAGLVATGCAGADAGTPRPDASAPGRDASSPPLPGADASTPGRDATSPLPGADASQARRDASTSNPGADAGEEPALDAAALAEDAAGPVDEDAGPAAGDARVGKDSGEGEGVVGGCGCGAPGSGLLGLSLLACATLFRRRRDRARL